MRVSRSERGVRGLKKAFVAMGGALACLALLAGCADKPTYDVDYDQSFPFSEFKTYRWYDDDHNSRESEYRRHNSSDQRVRNTADQELMQRGLRQGARGQADFWVNYHVTKRQTQKSVGKSGACMAAWPRELMAVQSVWVIRRGNRSKPMKMALPCLM